jgi:hypothetical protein
MCGAHTNCNLPPHLFFFLPALAILGDGLGFYPKDATANSSRYSLALAACFCPEARGRAAGDGELGGAMVRGC